MQRFCTVGIKWTEIRHITFIQIEMLNICYWKNYTQLKGKSRTILSPFWEEMVKGDSIFGSKSEAVALEQKN